MATMERHGIKKGEEQMINDFNKKKVFDLIKSVALILLVIWLIDNLPDLLRRIF